MEEGENQSLVLGFWGLSQKVFPFSPIHLNGCLRSPIYPLLLSLTPETNYKIFTSHTGGTATLAQSCFQQKIQPVAKGCRQNK